MNVPLPATFLDSNVAQVLVTFGEYVYDANLAAADADKLLRLGPRFGEDVDALHDLAQLGTWYGWPIVVSHGVQLEHAQAPAHKAKRLLPWDDELVDHYLTYFPDDADTSTFARAAGADQLELSFPRLHGTRLLCDHFRTPATGDSCLTPSPSAAKSS